MAEILPQIKISNGPSKLASPVKPQTANIKEGHGGARLKSDISVEGRGDSNGGIYSSKNTQNPAPSQTNADGRVTSPEEGSDSQPPIDPLSKHILKRTNTQAMAPQRTRNVISSDGDSGTPEASLASARTSSEPAIARIETSSSIAKDRKKGVSFLSRFIGSKKKDAPIETNDEDVETGDRRTEGMDADVFSQPIGFIPRFPAPPKYIKVRSHGKKEKAFNRVFLAQELRGRTGVEIAQAGGRLVKNGFKPGNTRTDGSAVWAMDFSKDGKYLAAGGQDFTVRVWAVISTSEERRAHEREEDAAGKDGERMRLNAPVFKTKTVQEYGGHSASILDLSWSKNNFLLSSSMDKTVRLWHVSRTECLCCFKHTDFVTSIQFHPRDDRFFLAGSLDSKLRLWSIPDKSVAFWKQLPDLITAVAFAPDGKTAIAGCLSGICLFYETEGLKYHTQIHVRSTHGKNAKGSKVTGIKAINDPPDDPNGEVKLLITSNDSRARVYNLRDKSLEVKLRGNENSCSQIHASFSDDARYVICGSEDRKAYIWSIGSPEGDKDKRAVEMFEAHSAIVTMAVMAPTKTRQLLGASGDPLYDICNPPPVTLISRTDSRSSSKPATEDGSRLDTSVPPTPALTDISHASKPEASPAYIARSAHPDGHIIVTADFMGRIKVFRQDCAYQKRLRNNEANFSKRMLGRSNSVATRTSKGSRRDSLSTTNNHPSSDRILSWRQSIASNNGSVDNVQPSHRSESPRKTISQTLHHSPRLPASATSPSISTTSPPRSTHRLSHDSKTQFLDPNTNNPTAEVRKSYPVVPSHNPEVDPLMLQGDHSYMFWNKQQYRRETPSSPNPDGNLHPLSGPGSGSRGTSPSSNASGSGTHLGVPATRELSAVSALSSDDEGANDDDDGEGGAVRCRRCGGATFRARGRGAQRRLECETCRETVTV